MVEILNKVSGAQGKEDDKFSVAKVPLPSFTNLLQKDVGSSHVIMETAI